MSDEEKYTEREFSEKFEELRWESPERLSPYP